MKQTYRLHNVFRIVLFTMFSCAALTLFGCSAESQNTDEQTETSSQTAFDTFCMNLFEEELASADTLDLHYLLLYPEKFGITQETVTLGSCQLEDMIRRIKDVDTLKAELLAFDRAHLTPEQQLTYDVLLESFNTSLLAKGMELYDQPLAPTIGVQAQLPILLAEYSFHSTDDIEDYLTMLSQTDQYYAEILEFEQQKAAAGLGPSDASIDAIIESCEAYLIDPESNFLMETFASRIADMEQEMQTELTPAEKLLFTARHNDAVSNHFIPAYQHLIQGMEALKGQGINDGGLAKWKHGTSYYHYLLKSGPGLSYTVPELKTALEKRMKQDIEALDHLSLQYPNLDEQLQTSSFSLSDPQQILEDLKRQMTRDFPVLSQCAYEVNYVPESLEETLSPAFYLTAPLDNTNHNVIYINDRYTTSDSNLYTTLAHEGFPGHLYQTVYNRTYAKTPLLSILSCSGANEGWATYVEHYAWTLENGLAPGVGEYHALMRSISLCVYGALDIGIHYDGWSKEQAADYITSFFRIDDDSIEQLWQTIIDSPTNYLEYCGGYLEIMEMRETAERELGEHFSPLEFHRFLLDIGPVPFSVIRKHFDHWLSSYHCSANFFA